MKHPTLLPVAVLLAGACASAQAPTQAPLEYMPANVCELRACVEAVNISARLIDLAEVVYYYTPESGSSCRAEQLTLFVQSFSGEVPQPILQHLTCTWKLEGAMRRNFA